jgi:hypothetical protein
MMDPFFGVVVDRAIDPKRIISLPARAAESAGTEGGGPTLACKARPPFYSYF